MNQDSTRKITIRLDLDDYEKLGLRGTPATVAAQLVRDGLRGGGSDGRLLEELRHLRGAVDELESTARFRQLTRDEVFTLSKITAQYKDEISATNEKTARFMKSFLERISTSMEMLSRVEKEISRIEGAASKYGQAALDIDRMAELSVGRSHQFQTNLLEIERRLAERTEAIVTSTGKAAIAQGKKMFLWGSAFLVFGLVLVFFLHFFGVFYPDPDWLRSALLGQKGGG